MVSEHSQVSQQQSRKQQAVAATGVGAVSDCDAAGCVCKLAVKCSLPYSAAVPDPVFALQPSKPDCGRPCDTIVTFFVVLSAESVVLLP